MLVPYPASARAKVACSAVLLLACASAHAQTVVRPRVLLVVDTSSSMIEEASTTNLTGGDGSLYYESGVLTRTGMYRGFLAGAPICPNPVGATFRGVDSRLYAAKLAVANVVNGSGDIDWGLMRYAGTECGDPDGDGVFDAFSTTPSYLACTLPGECLSGSCTGGRCDCVSDGDCRQWEFCINGACGRDPNLCGEVPTQSGDTSTREDFTCSNKSATIGVTQSGGCGVGGSTGSVGCSTPQACFSDAECGGLDRTPVTPGVPGQCALVGAGPARVCACQADANCPRRYRCDTNVGECVYDRSCSADGGYMLVDPSKPGYRADQVIPWTDGVEIYRDDGNGRPINPELHPAWGTAIGGSARTATQWYQRIKAAGVGAPLHDDKLQCRPYLLVLLTDGADTCDPEFGGNDSTGPAAAVKGFVASTVEGARLLNRVEVIGFNVAPGSSRTKLDEAARAGNSDRSAARYVDNRADLEAALADIVASAVLHEQCNGLDDTCDEIVDEGLGVYEACDPAGPPSCLSGGCAASGPSKARCTCTGGLPNQCNSGYACNVSSGAGFCVPTCTVGQGECLRSGVRKCGGACCVNDGQAACTPLSAGAPGTEICNNLDDDCNGQIDEGAVCNGCQPVPETCNGRDDDCDGIVDNNLVDTNQPCGSDEGECRPGLTACQPDAPNAFPHASDHLVCVNPVGPSPEICDGKDNNCDGVTDGMTQVCYSGAPATRGVGECRDGAQACTAQTGSGVPAWGSCTGEVLPASELCNGRDDDCNGVIDDVAGTGAACCTSGRCGVGACVAGSTQCSGGALLCVNEVGPREEICDGIDNDCNGVVDDVPGVGTGCVPQGGCAGTFACDTTAMQLVCVPAPMAPEICNGIDDDCDGMIDEAGDVATFDGRIDQICGAPVAPADLPPCKAGKTVCVDGVVRCEGSVGPVPNVCGQPSTDCQTPSLSNGMCAMGATCFEGSCLLPCAAGEFPCPGGFVCRTDVGLCIPDVCAQHSCPPGTYCQAGSDGLATCFDPCAGVDCPAGHLCKDGLCIDDSCKVFGCPAGQICVNDACEIDRCAQVACEEGTYCSPDTGACVPACIGPCPTGEECREGLCAPTPCTEQRCLAGQACLVAADVAMCVEDSCGGTGCNLGSVCCGGACVDDPCARVLCPYRAECIVNSRCEAACVAAPYEKVVGAGGGGFACAMASPRESNVAIKWFAVSLALFMLRARSHRRRRRDGQRAPEAWEVGE